MNARINPPAPSESTPGMAAAITSAVYHATGVRVRELPIKIENLPI
jgi:CO/xanthine dehydrogenase Mo-binding subunit